MLYQVKNKTLSWIRDMLILTFMIFLLIITMSGKSPDEPKMISLTKSSLFLNINVNTNVDCFTCEYESALADTVSIKNNEPGNMLSFEGFQLAIPVSFIDCHNDMMNSDLQDMLKMEDHPHILVNISDFETSKINYGAGKAEIALNIDGIEKKYEIDIANYFTKDELYFHGSFPVNLNDFCIDPPSRVLGLVKVDKVIKINFALAMNMN